MTGDEMRAEAGIPSKEPQLPGSDGPHIDMWNIRVEGQKVQVVRAGDFYILAKKLEAVESDRNELIRQLQAAKNGLT
jgi:hypothetical protein